MAVITLTFTASEDEISSGIPKTITISSNVPATIYFTGDGSTPTTSSPIYTEEIVVPTGINAYVLSAFGVDGDEVVGPTLTQTFAADTTRITVSRNVGNEGFVLDRYGTGADVPDWYDADGDTARFIDVDLETLDIIRKSKGFNGILEGTEIKVNVPDSSTTASFIDDGFVAFSTPETGELFNPTAKMIMIDNRVDNDLELIPRPYGSIINTESQQYRLREPADDATYVSGGFVRRFYDSKNRVMVSYYFDHNEARYIKNIQDLPDRIPNTRLGGNISGPPLIFQWMPRGRQSSI